MVASRARTDVGGTSELGDELDLMAERCAAALQIHGVLVTSVDGDRQEVLGGHGLPAHVRRGAVLAPSDPSCRAVAATGKPRLLQDRRTRHVDDPARLGAVAYAGLLVPTTHPGPVVLAALDDAPRTWRDRDLQVLRGFATMAAAMIDGRDLAQRCQELAQARAEAELLLAVATVGAGASLDAVLARLARHTGWPCVDVVLVDGDHLRSQGMHVEDRHLQPLVAAPRRGRAVAALAAEAIRVRTVVYDRDLVRALGEERGRAAEALGVRSACALPILVRHEAIGVVELLTTDEAPDPTAIDALASRLATVLGQVLDRRRDQRAAHRRTAELEVIAFHDELTGLLNRRGFFSVAEGMLARLHRQQRRAALLFVDLDRLKDVNDVLGHASGDALIRAAAGVLVEAFPGDVIARLGGDEFVALTPIDDADPAPTVQRLAATLAASQAADPTAAPLTWSVGAAVFEPTEDCSLDTLLGRADAQMYAVKRTRWRGR